MAVQILRKKFTVGQYHQMIESGILTDRDRVELIKGEIIEMSPVGRRHAACVDRLTELFVLSFASKAIVRTQNPIQLSNNSEPQPDLAVLRRRDDFYATGHPKPDDIFLVVEVSDTTVDFDREVKIPTYAEEGIAEAWLVDLNAQTLEVYRHPKPSGYQSKQQFNRGQTIAVPGFPDVQFSIEQLLG